MNSYNKSSDRATSGYQDQMDAHADEANPASTKITLPRPCKMCNRQGVVTQSQLYGNGIPLPVICPTCKGTGTAQLDVEKLTANAEWLNHLLNAQARAENIAYNLNEVIGILQELETQIDSKSKMAVTAIKLRHRIEILLRLKETNQ